MRRLSVIIPVMNEAEKIGNILQEVKKLKPLEIITVVNGSTDQTSSIAKTMGAKIINYEKPLGHDIGRAIGAYHATGDILLFLDGDFVIRSQQLLPFVNAIHSGNDIALNDLSRIMKRKGIPHAVSIVKAVINDYFNRNDLSINSLVAVPHAMSRKAIDRIGWWNLADPPLAQAIALHLKLKIVSPKYVDVISLNKVRKKDHVILEKGSPYPKSTSLIIGDHMKAMHYIGKVLGKRGFYYNDPSMDKNYEIPKKNKNIKRSIVITVNHKSQDFLKRIQSLKKDKLAEEFIVVLAGTDKNFMKQVKKTGALVLPVSSSMNTYAMRALGASLASGEIILFTESHSSMNQIELEPFFKEIEKGADISLNNVSSLLKARPTDPMQLLYYFLNISLKKPELLNNSLTITPHAIHRKVIDQFGWKSLEVPPSSVCLCYHRKFKGQSIKFNQQREFAIARQCTNKKHI
ncbi:glycosyltransferase [Virgibacillus sp. SK37]|uniref:glycosyltransferase family 2 protein n=1 Tax=Virgibacillus sp. SK37 TaxID=403957 RepID=UPI0011A632A4|nr:glycosyltransferase [Virgibacillus sp. SK37]